MKKMLKFTLILPLALLISALSAHAAEGIRFNPQKETESTVVYFDDGSRLIISPVYETKSHTSINTAANTVTKSRDIYCEDSNGNLVWKYTLMATFSYEYGVSSTCTSASYAQTIYDNAWSFSNGSASRSGNTAYGKGIYTKKLLGFDTKNMDVDIRLSCDVYGNVT